MIATAAAQVPAERNRAAARIRRVFVATINREEGDTGVHTHTRMLTGGLREAGVLCDVVGPFKGEPGTLGW